MFRYKLSAKIMFFFEIIAITKRKNVIFAANIEKLRNQVKREKISNNQITKIERKIRNDEQR